MYSSDYENVLSVVSETRPPTPLLPNLDTLWWGRSRDEEIRFATLFMRTSVKEFLVDLPSQFLLNGGRTLHTIHSVSQMPRLVKLIIRSEFFNTQTLVSILEDLPCLEFISLPRYHIEGAEIQAFSRLRHLVTLTPNTMDRDREHYDFQNFAPHLSEGAYPSISQLSFATDALSSITLIKNEFFPHRLRDLGLAMTFSPC